MRITIACIGALKEEYAKAAFRDYSRQILKYCTFDVMEVRDIAAPESLSPAEASELKRKESASLYSKIRPGSYVIALDPAGERMEPGDLANRFRTLADIGRGDITFTIGGSLGLHEDALKKSDLRLSLSRMTFPHQLARLIIAEQILFAFQKNIRRTET